MAFYRNLGGAHVFRKRDLVSGCIQCSIHKGSIPLPTVCKQLQNWERAVMPMGLGQIPRWFQPITCRVCEGLERARLYNDKIGYIRKFLSLGVCACRRVRQARQHIYVSSICCDFAGFIGYGTHHVFCEKNTLLVYVNYKIKNVLSILLCRWFFAFVLWTSRPQLLGISRLVCSGCGTLTIKHTLGWPGLCAF